MDAFEFAKIFAPYVHEGKVDKAGMPYILHPLTVASKVTTEKEKIVAILHDVVEDTDVTVDTIKNLFGEEIGESVRILSKKESEKYFDYIKSIRDSGDETAIKVKIADLEHNMDLTRLSDITQKDIYRKVKYETAYNILTKKR